MVMTLQCVYVWLSDDESRDVLGRKQCHECVHLISECVWLTEIKSQYINRQREGGRVWHYSITDNFMKIINFDCVASNWT